MSLELVELPNTRYEEDNVIFEYYQYGPYVLCKEYMSDSNRNSASYSVVFAHNFWDFNGWNREIDPDLDTNTSHMVSTFTNVPMYFKWNFHRGGTHGIEMTFSTFNGTHEKSMKRVEEMMIAINALKAFEGIMNTA